MPNLDTVIDLHKKIESGLSWGAPGLRALWSSRLTPPLNPLNRYKLYRDLLTFGFTPAIGYAGGAARHSNETATIDESGWQLTFREAEDLTRQCTAGLHQLGIGHDSVVAVLGRNSIGLTQAIAAVSRTGADLVYLNTGFRASQIETIIADRGVELVLVDEDLAERIPSGTPTARLNDPRSWSEADHNTHTISVGRQLSGRHIILTSGTTGKPKGADRSQAPVEAIVALLDSLPYRQRATHIMAAPLFHSWGWLNHRLSSLLDPTEVMIPKPTAKAVLDAAEAHQAEIIVTTPVVIRRLAATGPSGRDLSKLRGVLVSGSAIPGPVVTAFGDKFGPVLYNLYGSTEVGFATCASPDDLMKFPDTAGRPLQGVEVSILDSAGAVVATGEEGEIWVGSAASFDGYIDGGDKDRRDNLLSTGDSGYFDEDGRLFVLGRLDDLIISGGENVHPSEVEAVLRHHPQVADVVAVGHPNPEFGQAVVAYVVPTETAGTDTGLSDADLAADIMNFARENLAGYQRPGEIIIRQDLPVNETGKVLRRLLEPNH